MVSVAGGHGALTVVVASDVDGDGAFHEAEDYWLNARDKQTLGCIRHLTR